MQIVVSPALRRELEHLFKGKITDVDFVTSAPTKAVVMGQFGNMIRFSGVRQKTQRELVENLKAILEGNGYTVQILK